MLLLGVTGSIAAYKAADLASRLSQQNVEVRVVMTRQAQKFVTPLTFESLTARAVLTDQTEYRSPMAHIDLTDNARLFLIAPASANILARLAYGFAEDVLSTTALAAKCPLWVAPAMNSRMWEHPATQENIRVLKQRQVKILEPSSGSLACGHVGVGRLVEVSEILTEIQKSGLLGI